MAQSTKTAKNNIENYCITETIGLHGVISFE